MAVGANPGRSKRMRHNKGEGFETGDMELRCCECHAPFAFTMRAQALHRERGFTEPPRRCPACRKAKRLRNQEGAGQANKTGRPLPAGANGGLTYEERRVLGKNRKERRADAKRESGGNVDAATDGSHKKFRKGMDPTEARLLRLAREGKMKRAMHRPEQKVDLGTYQNSLMSKGEELSGRAGDQPADRGSRPLPKQIRDLERLLKKGNLPKQAQEEHKQRLSSLKAAFAAQKTQTLEDKMARKYKMVKFFEQQKLTRRLKSVDKKLRDVSGAADTAALQQQRDQIVADLRYVQHYPRHKKYISLFPVGGADAYTRKMQAAMRAEIEASIEKERLGQATTDDQGDDESAGTNQQNIEQELADDDFFAAPPPESAPPSSCRAPESGAARPMEQSAETKVDSSSSENSDSSDESDSSDSEDDGSSDSSNASPDCVDNSLSGNGHANSNHVASTVADDDSALAAKTENSPFDMEALQQKLLSELQQLPLSTLKQRARAAGVKQSSLDMADDEDDIKAAVIDLIMDPSSSEEEDEIDEEDYDSATGSSDEDDDASAESSSDSESVGSSDTGIPAL